tara:strand:+ start:2387 stop:3541 length:1155 start_codon:yes stop_codon:yes gene_type:complete
MDNTSYIELNESALANNFQYIRERLAPGARLSHVVKGNAYGHGIDPFVPLAHKLGADHFSVFDVHEAEQVLKALSEPVDIIIMGMVAQEQLEWVIQKEIGYFVFDSKRLEQSVLLAKKIEKKAKVHIELETGMNRSGFEMENWPQISRYLIENAAYLDFQGLCTHFAGAESIANHLRVRQQIKNFRKGRALFKNANLKPKWSHAACSAAFLRFPKTHFDLVRIGILQYGFWPNMETYISIAGLEENPVDPLQRVISWKSRVMNVKKVHKGEYIGYGTSYLATQEMTVASVPVGYSHGFSRSLSNSGRALVRGMRVGVVGVVNMNVMMVDVSHLDHVEIGDEVVLIGKQGDQEISVSSFSEYSDQMNYELLTRLPLDIQRRVKIV